MMMPDSNPKPPNTRSDKDGLSGILSLAPQSPGSEAVVERSACGTSRSTLAHNHRGSISERDIRNELARITESPIFVQSERLVRFLRFTVESTLGGNAEKLKEYVIGTHVYGRKSSYQPT